MRIRAKREINGDGKEKTKRDGGKGMDKGAEEREQKSERKEWGKRGN